MSPRIWLKIDLNVKHFLRISGDFVTNLMKINSSLQTKTTMIETRLNFSYHFSYHFIFITISHIHRERTDALESLHCFVTLHHDANYVDVFLDSLTETTCWHFTV